MRVGVTGSTGLIGTALCTALTKRGDDVVRFVRPSSTAVSGTTVRWDPTTGSVNETDLTAVGSLDGIIHLAGSGIADRRWSPSYRAGILTSRTKSTSLIVDVVKRMNVGVLVSGSAIGFYGNRGDEVLFESSTPGRDYVAEVCQAWEGAAAPLAGTGTAVSFARTGVVLDQRGGALAKLLPIFKAGLGGTLGSGRQWMSPVTLDDEVRALLFALDTKLTGAFNITSPAPCTNRELTHALAKALLRPSIVMVPPFAMRAVLGRECADNTVLTSQRVVPNALIDAGFRFNATAIGDMLDVVLS